MTGTTICFVHIPKTAGSAMRAALVQMLGGWENVLWFDVNATLAEFMDADPQELRKYAIVGGHAAVTHFEKLPGRKIYSAVLREPVARAVSLFEYIVRGGDTAHPLRSELQDLGLRRALEESDIFRKDITNTQCEMVGGKPTFESAQTSLAANKWIVGTDEAPQQLLDKIARTLGKPSIPLGQDNVGAPGYFERLATPEIVEMIADLNQEDARLYEFVATRQTRTAARGWRRFLSR